MPEEIKDLDPLAERVLDISFNCLKSKSEITIHDLIDATGLKDSAIRDRLTLLVNQGYLSEVKGIGRRPTYYFHPKPSPSCATTEEAVKALEVILIKLEGKEKEFAIRLESIIKEKQSIQQSIKILQQEQNK